MEEFNNDFLFENIPSEKTPRSAENLNIAIYNTRYLYNKLLANHFNLYHPCAFKYQGVDKAVINADDSVTITTNASAESQGSTLLRNIKKNTNYEVSFFVNSIETDGEKRITIMIASYDEKDSIVTRIVRETFITEDNELKSYQFNSGDSDKIAFFVSGHFGANKSGSIKISKIQVLEI